MAAKFTEAEREERIILVGEYFLAHPDCSTRDIADYFSNLENGFKISNVTVLDYIRRYKEMLTSTKLEEVDDHIESNKPKGVSSPYVRYRVLLFAQRILEGMSVDEIACDYNISYWTVYRDLSERLAKIDQELYLKVCDEFDRRRLNNLQKKK